MYNLYDEFCDNSIRITNEQFKLILDCILIAYNEYDDNDMILLHKHLLKITGAEAL